MAEETPKKNLSALLNDERMQQAMQEATAFLGEQYRDVFNLATGQKPDSHDHADDGHAHSHEPGHAAHSHATGNSYAAITAASGLLSAGVMASEKMNLPEPMKLLLNLSSSVPFINGVLRPQISHAVEERRVDEIARHGLTSTLLGAGIASNNHEWANSGAMLGFLNAVAGEMEGKFHDQQSAAINDMRHTIPQEVKRVGTNGQMETVPLSDVQIGDELFVPQGGFIPADGTVLKGKSQVNTRFYTGQETPETIDVDDRVYQGATLLDGGVNIRVDHKPEQSMISTLLDNVEQAPASSHQTKVGQVIDKYTYLLLGATALQFGISLMKRQGGQMNFKGAMEDSLELAIKASPCTLMAAPLIYPFISKRLASEHGIYVNNQRGLEAARDVDTVLTDLTGTLTQGKPQVMDVFAVDGSGNKIDESELLGAVAAAEKGSLHPLATAISAEAKTRGIRTGAHLEAFGEESGKGVRCQLGGSQVMVGRRSWLEEGMSAGENIPKAVLDAADAAKEKGHSVVYTRNGDQWGVISLDDPLRENAKETVETLKARGIQVAMVTGDHAQRANRIAQELGIDTVYADAKPEDKADLVRQYKADGKCVAMIGDGVNDSLAMQLAQTAEEGEKEGVAFAIKGTAPLTESTASAALEDISQLPGLLEVSDRVNQIAKRNGTMAAGWTALLAGSHLFGVKMGPLVAALAHEAPAVGMVATSSKSANALSSAFKAPVSTPNPSPPAKGHER